MAEDPQPLVPPAARDLPEAALDSATDGASMLDASAATGEGRNLLAHALVQLERDGWLRPEPLKTDTSTEPEHWPSPPALVYIGTDGTACTLDRDLFEPSLMGARERAICRAFLEYAAQKLTNFDAVGGALVTQGPKARPSR